VRKLGDVDLKILEQLVGDAFAERMNSRDQVDPVTRVK
jgi:hypothetical protein